MKLNDSCLKVIHYIRYIEEQLNQISSKLPNRQILEQNREKILYWNVRNTSTIMSPEKLRFYKKRKIHL